MKRPWILQRNENSKEILVRYDQLWLYLNLNTQLPKGPKSTTKQKKYLVLWEQFFRKSLKPISQERGFGNDYAWVVHKRGDRVKESE